VFWPLLAVGFATQVAPATEATPPLDWENPALLGIHKLPPRTDSYPVEVRSLDGNWKFSWVGKPEQRPLDFYRTDFNDASWPTIDVPSCVETRGYGINIYTNVRYPFLTNPPFIDHSYNPVSSYRRSFKLPQNWKSGRTVVRFDGVAAAFYLWVNGQKVGFSKDSKGPAEFDVSQFVRPGTNQMAVEVYRWSDGSYLEDQDTFRFSGIFRPVKIYHEPEAALRDVVIDSSVEADLKAATIRVTTGLPETSRVTYSLRDAAGRPVAELQGGPNGSIRIGQPQLWTAETPTLYSLKVATAEDSRTFRIGLRRLEWKSGVFRVNNRPTKILGVDRHEHSSVNGASVTRAEMIQDIVLMKRANINAVRCSHYMNDERWYDLCDEYGLYLIDEANIESHGMGYSYERSLGNNPVWQAAHLDRTRRMVASHRNHPSIIMWSLGNEAGPGVNFKATSDLVHSMDPSRPVHYERDNSVTDVDSVMYPDVNYVLDQGRQRRTKPFFVCEYAHAMGNSVGNLKEYVDAFFSSDLNMGGCIWDWHDKALRKPLPTGVKHLGRSSFYAYGGDYGDHPNDGPFVGTGVVLPDRQITPKYLEVQRVYQPVRFSTVGYDRVRFDIINGFYRYEDLEFGWKSTRNGKVTGQGTLKVDSKGIAKLPQLVSDYRFSGEKMLTVQLRNTTLWAPAGYVIAKKQILATDASPAEAKMPTDPLTVTKSAGRWKFSGPSFSIDVNTTTGELQNYYVDNRELFGAHGPSLGVFRAFTDTDIWLQRPYTEAGLRTIRPYLQSLTSERLDARAQRVRAVIDYLGFKGNGVRLTANYTILGDGKVVIDSSFSEIGSLPPLPRIGFDFQPNSKLENLTWYGRGPGESYSDRYQSTDLGTWRSTVSKQWSETLRPQEHGNHIDTTYVAFTDATGYGFTVGTGRYNVRPFHFQASHYDPEKVDQSRHQNGEPARLTPLNPEPRIYARLDAGSMGLGGASCGPGPMAEYQLTTSSDAFRMPFRLHLQPVRPGGSVVALSPPVAEMVSLRRMDNGQLEVDSGFGPYVLKVDGKPVDAYNVNLAKGGLVTVQGTNTDQYPAPTQTFMFPPTVARELIRPAGWMVDADSFEPGEGEPAHAIDGDPRTIWHTAYSASEPTYPHWLRLDFGMEQLVNAIEILPRGGQSNGRFTQFRVETSDDGNTWKTVKQATAKDSSESFVVTFPPVKTRWLRLVTEKEVSGRPWSSLSELKIFGPPTP